ncbi:hypothetical protein [Sphingobium sp. YG1]|uniref:hypothetical protein n=1 Tax=Sphingobium sp. YG1 TaxID=2082188 RepID=UPI000DBB8F77|nr:hypothetical protein [Sphingobium sp. YG1]BBC99127.1 hypothetical protein YGS_C1P0383 [Sphingobium sp. YG1]
MKWILSHGAAAEMARRSKPIAGTPSETYLRNRLFDTHLGVPIHTSAMFPFPANCSSCAGTGDGREQSTWCISCAGTGQILVDGMMRDDHANQTMLITRQVPGKAKAFAIAFPTTLTVPAAPMRGRIKEVRLP